MSNLPRTQAASTPRTSTSSPPKVTTSPISHTSPSSQKASQFSQRRRPTFLALTVSASITFGVTAWFARATFSARTSSRTENVLQHVFKIDTGDTLTILVLLSGILSFLTRSLLDSILESIQWGLIGRHNGVPITTILGLSPTTGWHGTLGILIGKFSEAKDRAWSAFKLTLRIAIWVSGVVLFLNTSLKVVYKSSFTYPVVAGIGPFNGSYVGSLIEYYRQLNAGANDYDVVPYSTLAHAFNLVVNPQHSITTEHIACTTEPCDTYLLPGGLETAHPWDPSNLTDHPVTILKSAPGTQIEFKEDLDGEITFDDGECDLFYQHPFVISMRFCVAHSPRDPGSFTAGVYVCTNGTVGNTCLADPFQPNLTTTFSIFVRTADLVTSRSNYSILSIANPSPAIPDYSLDIDTYRSALRWLFNFTAAGIPAPSSIVQYFWSAPEQIANNVWSGASPRQAFQSVIAYPLWFFNVNNAGNVDLLKNNSHVVFPAEYHTTASIASPYTRIVVNQAMFIIFVVLQSLLLLTSYLILIILWSTDIRIPKLSAYPLIDFTFRTQDLTAGHPVATRDILGTNTVDYVNVREAVQGTDLGLRSVVDPALPLRDQIKAWFGRMSRKGASVKVKPSP